MRYLRLFALFARTELQFELAYRLNFLFDLLSISMIIATSVAAVLVLYSYTTALNGWTLPQMLVLLGVYYIVQGIGELVFRPSFQMFMEHVRLGTLDYLVLKPVSTQFLVSVRHTKIANLGQLVLGVTVVALGAQQLASTLSVGLVATFALALACGLVLIYALLLCLSTLSFWFVRVENLLAIYEAFLDAARFPVDIYPGWLRATMSTVIPIGVAVTVPAQAIAGRLDGSGLAAIVAVAGGAWLFSRWFFRRGLRSYTGASA